MMDKIAVQKLASHFNKRVYVYGAGRQGKFLFNLLHDHVDIAGFIDTDSSKQSNGEVGIPVYGLDRLHQDKDCQVLISLALPLKDSSACLDVLRLLENDYGFTRGVSLYTQSDIFESLSDEEFVRVYFEMTFDRPINLENPRTINEKVQWLKLYDRKPLYTDMADKVAMRKIVEDRVGSKYVVPLLGVWDSFDDIDFDQLPNEFVLKCSHDSASYVICKDKVTFDYEYAKNRLEKALGINFHMYSREWVYKDIKPQIIAEKYMGFIKQDYRFVCYNGDVKWFICAIDWADVSRQKYQAYLTDFTYLPVKLKYPINPDYNFIKPEFFDEMMDLSAKLSKDVPLLRVDLWEQDGQIYVNELSFYLHSSGFFHFEPSYFDELLGMGLVLPKIQGGSN